MSAPDAPPVPPWWEVDDPHLTDKMRQVAEIAQAERDLGPAVEQAVAWWFEQARAQVIDTGEAMTAAVALGQWPSPEVWRRALEAFVTGVLSELFRSRFTREVHGEITVDVDGLIADYLDQVLATLETFPDDVAAEARWEYRTGLTAGASETTLTRRIAGLLRLDAPSRSRRRQIRQLQRTLDDPDTSESVRRQARQRLATLQQGSRRSRQWWPWVAQATRTHALGALNAGTFAGARAEQQRSGQQSFQVWWSAEDNRVRPAHVDAHGQVQPVGQTFQVGGFPMRFPGDPRAPVDLVANCRCSLLSVPRAEADRLRRRADQAEFSAHVTPTHVPEVSMTTSLEAGEQHYSARAITAATSSRMGWRGAIAPLDRPSPDGRMLASPEDAGEAPLHRELPLPLLYQERTGPGHDNAVIVGRIDELWIEGGYVYGRGEFDMADATAQEVVRKIADRFHRWVSITHDPDADYTMALYRDGVEVDPADVLVDTGHGQELDDSSVQPVRIARNFRLSDATLVATPAFEDATIELVPLDTGTETEPDEVEPNGELAMLDEQDTPDDDLPRLRAEPTEWDAREYEPDTDTGAEQYAVSQEKRDRAEKAGHAMEGGRYPIENREDLQNAIRAVGRAGGPDGTAAERAKVRRHIMKQATRLGLTEMIPDTWNTDGTLTDSNSSARAAVTAAGDRVAWCQRVAEVVPFEPDPSWFVNPELSTYTKPTIGDDGRVYGHICPWDAEHSGMPEVYPPRHGDEWAYAKFHRHPVRVAGGGRVMTGPIATGGHAALKGRSMAQVMSHYDQPDYLVANVACGEDAHGIWFAGALRPGVSPLQVAHLDSYFVSGDWRNNELLAACVVSVPGFHKPVSQDLVALAASGEPQPILADAAPQLVVEGGDMVALLSGGMAAWSESAQGPSSSTVRLALDGDPAGWGREMGRSFFEELQRAQTEQRQQREAAAQHAELQSQAGELIERVGPIPDPPQVAALKQRVYGQSEKV